MYMKKSIFFITFFVFLTINLFSQRDFTFCYSSIAVTIFDGGNAEMVRYNSSGSIVSKVTGTFDLYGKGSPTEVLKIQFQGNEYRYDLIRDGRGTPSLIIDNQGRKYSLCKTEVRDQAQDDIKVLNDTYAKWREEERLLKIKYAALQPEINKIIGNPIRISNFEVASNDVYYGYEIYDAILDLKNGWRIPTVKEISLIYSKLKKSIKGYEYATSDINPSNAEYNAEPNYENRPYTNYKIMFPRNPFPFSRESKVENKEPYLITYSDNPTNVRFVRDISAPAKLFSKKWDWFLSANGRNYPLESDSRNESVYKGIKLNSTYIKDYPYFPLSCATLPNNLVKDSSTNEIEKVNYKIRFTILTLTSENIKLAIQKNLNGNLNKNLIPTTSKEFYDDTKKDNPSESRYDKRMFITTSMVLKDIKKVELFNSDSVLCSSVLDLDKYKTKASTNKYVADNINGSLVWASNSQNSPFGYDIVFSAPIRSRIITFENFERHRFFYFKFTTIDGTVIVSDQFPFPYGLAVGKDKFSASRLYLNKKNVKVK